MHPRVEWPGTAPTSIVSPPDEILATDRHEYVDRGMQYYEQRHRDQQIHVLKKRAAKLGLQIVEPQMA
jgi:hypothetical protein